MTLKNDPSYLKGWRPGLFFSDSLCVSNVSVPPLAHVPSPPDPRPPSEPPMSALPGACHIRRGNNP